MTQPLQDYSTTELRNLEAELARDYELVGGNRMALDLSRGKPAPDQLSLSEPMDNAIQGDFFAADGTDVRNYGNLRGLAEARQLGEEIMQVPAANIITAGNSSLNLMHLVVSTALSHGLWGDQRRWSNSNPVKILTPVPGYDRHFTLSAALGIEMVNVAMHEDGPDMQQARELAAADPAIKGIWCVPKYANPTGCIYSDEVVADMADLPTVAAADDFVVLWDNAYAVHDLNFPSAPLASIFAASQARETADHIVQFASTSKITFAGGGIAFLAASDLVLTQLEKQLSFMTIGADKVNQLRHARFLCGRVSEHMQNHAALLRPKFELVLATLQTQLAPLQIATWSEPAGGYFVSLDLRPGLARKVVALAGQVGLTLTPAGATFPHGEDPEDKNVRIAPTFATLTELEAAMQVLTLCVKLATVRQQLNS
ncbi:MAG: aminotransferase class I/II-fold pyridoxal phosphate-dependent enzyme [Pseudomonadota bacterium]